MATDLVHRLIAPRAEPEGALALLHGRGADERDLEPLLYELDPERRLLGILPRGPLALTPGGAHWYVVREVGFPDPETFLPSLALLGGWLDGVLADAGLDVGRTILGGFSQGAVMSYALGLGAGRPRPAGIVAMSGFVPSVDGFELELESRAGLPVSISHGSADSVISVSFGREAHDLLERAGLDVRYQEDPAGHTILPAALAQARAVVRAGTSA